MARKEFWATGRVRLRAAEEADLNFLSEQRKTPDSLRQWYEDEVLFPMSEKELRDGYLDDINNFYKDDKRLFIIEADGYAGQLSVWYANRRAGVLRHGIFLEEVFRGRGLAKDALVIALDFYFNELGYRKACPYIYPFNKNSLSFHTKFGFAFEARLIDEHYTRGEWHDILYYSLFKDDFNRLHKDALWSAD